jgi:hypothetical protein
MSPNASKGCRCAVFRCPILMLRTAFSMPGITCVLCTSKIKNGDKGHATRNKHNGTLHLPYFRPA